MQRLSLITLIGFLFFSCENKPEEKNNRTIKINNIVDLTHTLTAEFPFIPVKKLTYPFELIPMATLKENGVAANSWYMSTSVHTSMRPIISLKARNQ